MKVERSNKRAVGSMPARYQRNRVPTANEWRRQCKCGAATPDGTVSCSSGNSLWNAQLIVLGPIAERHQAIFSKLRLANDQKLVIKIDVLAAQP